MASRYIALGVPTDHQTSIVAIYYTSCTIIIITSKTFFPENTTIAITFQNPVVVLTNQTGNITVI